MFKVVLQWSGVEKIKDNLYMRCRNSFGVGKFVMDAIINNTKTLIIIF